MSDFHGELTGILENQFLQLEYLTNSARIVRFSPHGKTNIFADLGRSSTETPYGSFFFRGGHRLWHAPEAMPRTYIPDNGGAVVRQIPRGVRIDMPAETWTNIAKSIEIQLNPDRPQVTIRHELRNDGAWPVELSAWALTMMKLGGVGIFPQPEGIVDEAGLLPNRRLLLWPYTQIADPRLTLRDDFVLVHPTSGLTPLKIGYLNPHGWMGYWIDGVLFIKRFDALSDVRFPDHGCNAESYCNAEFIELESLGPLSLIPPSKSILHTELWEIYETLDMPFIPSEIQRLIVSQT